MTIFDLFNADVDIERDVPYVRDSSDPRQYLDIYSGPDRANRPVVLFFHGGGWRSGDKRLFEHLGRALVVRGLTTVTVNYRLTPAVRHPLHVEDCASATAWVQSNIATRGGDPERLFLFGHSAGAHLASLLALDPRYRSRVGVPARSVRGVIAISAPFDLTDHAETTAYTTCNQIHEAFSPAVDDLADASPINYVRKDAPAFLVAVAEGDSKGVVAQGRRFVQRLRAAGGEVFLLTVKGRDHYSIVRRFGPTDDTTASSVAEFVNHHSSLAAP